MLNAKPVKAIITIITAINHRLKQALIVTICYFSEALKMTANKRFILLFMIDLIIVWFSIETSYLLRFYGDIPDNYSRQMLQYCLISSFTFGGSLYYFGLYRRIWKYASIGEIVAILKAILVGAILSYIFSLLLFDERLPLGVEARVIETTLLLVGGTRFYGGWSFIRNGTDAMKSRTVR